MKSFYRNSLALALMGLTLAACSHGTKPNSEGGVNGSGDDTMSQGVANADSLQSVDGGLSQLSSSDRQTLAQLNTKVYFAFNKYDLRPADQKTAQAHANFLLSHPGLAVLLSGHADPRGSHEYNFHLGQKRADSVKSFLVGQGVAANQVCTVSYGDLKLAASPKDFGGNWEKAYQLDRRVQFEYGQSCQQGQSSVQNPIQTGAL